MSGGFGERKMGRSLILTFSQDGRREKRGERGCFQMWDLEEVHVFVAGAGVHQDDGLGAGEEVPVNEFF